MRLGTKGDTSPALPAPEALSSFREADTRSLVTWRLLAGRRSALDGTNIGPHPFAQAARVPHAKTARHTREPIRNTIDRCAEGEAELCPIDAPWYRDPIATISTSA